MSGSRGEQRYVAFELGESLLVQHNPVLWHANLRTHPKRSNPDLIKAVKLVGFAFSVLLSISSLAWLRCRDRLSSSRLRGNIR